ncbi:quinoprotein dehydrogenase-associated SoxYZ-like carrier [Croceicoccus ponticola]|uniref:Quinoprotein dehydrogenase-associated SoxYZ-like carrier n=1 Tax=Croceicoccus ponticola TaxID=2217664 RepID=A0A437GW44_9SPHN|nr:quinoprotein dehydrogenase-associated SoxYZ-like carrier [Croceicoccus ponticola]RVQ66082.1 quinoprotein dehydrogenase-associated SoxYZ-like carrier [Croceicoccus ponticola]
MLAFAATPAWAAPLPADPLGSPMWDYHASRIFEGATLVFDDRVKVILPVIAEDQHVVPVTVDARALQGVQRIILFADLNPIPVAIDYRPLQAAPFVATRIKLDQRTPVRAAVLLADGVWHVAGGWIDAAGGGCSAPPASRVRGDWADHLGEMRGAGWVDKGGMRLRFGFRHPMDTGLVESIPAYNIEELAVTDATGATLAKMTIYGSVAEDPAFTLEVQGADGPMTVAARDTSGLEFKGSIAASSGQKLVAAQ